MRIHWIIYKLFDYTECGKYIHPTSIIVALVPLTIYLSSSTFSQNKTVFDVSIFSRANDFESVAIIHCWPSSPLIYNLERLGIRTFEPTFHQFE